MRCERCKTSELSLVTFGVLDCPTCGRVDADGNLVAPAPGDDTGPQTFESERASFVAPPPVGAPAPAFVATAPTGREMPNIFFGTMAISAIVDIGAAVASHSVLGFILRVMFYGALMTGKPWARTLSLVGAVLSMAGCVALVLVFPGAAPVVKAMLTVVLVMNAWWLYVLLRPDTAAYFSRVN